MSVSFRHSAGFGKRMEYNIIGKMLMEGLDVYIPLVDDHGVDAIIKKKNGTFVTIRMFLDYVFRCLFYIIQKVLYVLFRIEYFLYVEFKMKCGTYVECKPTEIWC